MDEHQVSSFLEKAKLGYLLPIFEAQKIDDVSILTDLDEIEINTLTKNSIGDKIKLKRLLKTLNDDKSSDTKADFLLF